MSPEMQQKALAWLEEKWVADRVCPICNARTWSVQNGIAELREFSGGDLIVGGQQGIYPAYLVMCKNCGYMHLFNAIAAGLVEKSEPRAER